MDTDDDNCTLRYAFGQALVGLGPLLALPVGAAIVMKPEMEAIDYLIILSTTLALPSIGVIMMGTSSRVTELPSDKPNNESCSAISSPPHP